MADVEFTIERSGYLPIHLNTDHGGSYALQSGTTGFGVPQVVPQFARGAGNGASYRGERVDTRVMDLEILIMGESRIATGELLRKLSNIMRARRNQPLPKLVAEYATGEVYEVAFVYRSGLEIEYSEAQSRSLRVVVSVECPDPFWVARDSESFTIGNDSAAVGLLPDLAALNVSASTAIGSVPVENPGDVDTEVSWQLTGPGGPTTVEVNGEGFTYEPVLASGEVVFVDGRDRAVVDADGVNKYSGLAASPRFPLLQPGMNDVFISMEGASQGSWVESGLVFGSNVVANASMEASSGSSAMFTNLVTNPSMEASSGVVTVRTNLVTNPSFEVDTAGWLSLNSTISRVTSDFYVGSASLQSAATATGYAYFRSNVSASTTYTMSAWVKGTAGQIVTPAIVEYTSAMGYVSETNGANVTLTGSWQRISVTRTLGSTAGIVDIRVRNLNAHTFYVDAVQLQVGSTASDYFDGSTAASGDFTYAWSGTAHASTSLQRGTNVVGLGPSLAAPLQSSEWSSTGTKSLRIVPTAASASSDARTGSASTFAFGVQPGKTYTAKAKLRLSQAQTGSVDERGRRISAYISTNGSSFGTILRSTQSPNTAGIYDHSLTFDIPSNATGVLIMLGNGVSAGNGDVWWDDLLVVEGTYTGDYFDGNTISTDSDFTIAWNGYANASTSSIYADAITGINGMTPINAVSNRSSQWYKVGTKSYRIIPTSSSNETYGHTPSYTITAGKQYTATGVVRIPEALIGTLHADALKLRVNINNGTSYVKTEAAPNTAGEYTLSVMFTAPAGATTARLELMNGASAGNGNVWWDTIGLIDIPNATFFDGSTPTVRENAYVWTGTPNDSTSQWRQRALEGKSSVTAYYKPKREVIY